MAVLPHDVEKHVGDGDLLHLPANLRLRGQPHALLDLLEAWAALVVERDDLAVEDDLRRTQGATHGRNLRVARGDGLAAPAQQANDSALDVSLGTYPVPFELETPRIVWRRRFAEQLGEHRLDALRHRL